MGGNRLFNVRPMSEADVTRSRRGVTQFVIVAVKIHADLLRGSIHKDPELLAVDCDCHPEQNSVDYSCGVSRGRQRCRGDSGVSSSFSLRNHLKWHLNEVVKLPFAHLAVTPLVINFYPPHSVICQSMK